MKTAINNYSMVKRDLNGPLGERDKQIYAAIKARKKGASREYPSLESNNLLILLKMWLLFIVVSKIGEAVIAVETSRSTSQSESNVRQMSKHSPI